MLPINQYFKEIDLPQNFLADLRKAIMGVNKSTYMTIGVNEELDKAVGAFDFIQLNSEIKKTTVYKNTKFPIVLKLIYIITLADGVPEIPFELKLPTYKIVPIVEWDNYGVYSWVIQPFVPSAISYYKSTPNGEFVGDLSCVIAMQAIRNKLNIGTKPGQVHPINYDVKETNCCEWRGKYYLHDW